MITNVFADTYRSAQETWGKVEALVPELDALAGWFFDIVQQGGKVLACGNGGSAADALHLCEELVGRYRANRRALPAVCLSADATVMTCVINDFGADAVFSRQVEALGNKGDVLVGFSTSGNSENVRRALAIAKDQGVHTLALLGKDGGLIHGLADREIIVPSNDTARIQEVHTWILHGLLEKIERELVRE
ncbi:MAG: D-sedoheptulose 7-phosphate isomerase [Verrucomicrobiales bacterium]